MYLAAASLEQQPIVKAHSSIVKAHSSIFKAHSSKPANCQTPPATVLKLSCRTAVFCSCCHALLARSLPLNLKDTFWLGARRV